MSDPDIQILCLILEKEAAFQKEIRAAIRSASSALQDELSDYPTGLNDLKNDVLIPAKKKATASMEKEDDARSLFEDKYWYFERT